jgi:hypothetical protein
MSATTSEPSPSPAGQEKDRALFARILRSLTLHDTTDPDASSPLIPLGIEQMASLGTYPLPSSRLLLPYPPFALALQARGDDLVVDLPAYPSGIRVYVLHLQG